MESASGFSFPMLLAIAAGLVAIGVAAYFITRAMKGSLKIAVKQQSFRSGETITGTVTVTAKKPIEVDRMYVALIGERETRERESDGGTSTSWEEIYRVEVDIMLGGQLRAGSTEVHDFSLVAPGPERLDELAAVDLEQLESAMAESGNELASTLLKGVGALAKASGNLSRGKLRWSLSGRLETKGVDLADSERIHVSLKGME